jgi:hypothetical protein
MAVVNRGRFTAESDGEQVVFLIGMRINRLTKPWKWVPLLAAMPRMLAELGRRPDLGLLGAKLYLGGRTLMVVQYWSSFRHLERYARDPDLAHLPAWRAFNRRVRDNGDVGIFHETYLTGPATRESLYANMPPFGLARATVAVPLRRRTDTAAARLGVREGEIPPAEGY